MKPGAKIPHKKQCPLKKEALKGIQPLIQRFLTFGLILPCPSPYDIPTCRERNLKVGGPVCPGPEGHQ